MIKHIKLQIKIGYWLFGIIMLMITTEIDDECLKNRKSYSEFSFQQFTQYVFFFTMAKKTVLP